MRVRDSDYRFVKGGPSFWLAIQTALPNPATASGTPFWVDITKPLFFQADGSLVPGVTNGAAGSRAWWYAPFGVEKITDGTWGVEACVRVAGLPLNGIELRDESERVLYYAGNPGGATLLADSPFFPRGQPITGRKLFFWLPTTIGTGYGNNATLSCVTSIAKIEWRGRRGWYRTREEAETSYENKESEVSDECECE